MTRQNASTSGNIRWPRLFIWGGILLLLLAIGQKGWRVFRIAQSFRDHQTTAESLLANGWQQANPETIVTLTHDLRADTVDLIAEAEPFLPITPYLEWVPRVGPLMPHAETLIRLGDNGTQLAVTLVDGLHPALEIMQADGDLTTKLPSLMATIEQAEPNLKAADPLFAAILNDYETLKADPAVMALLPDSILQRQAEIDPLLPFAYELLKFAPNTPALAGYPEPVTYLVVAQNSDELRATGGFISALAPLVINQGQIDNIDFQDIYAIDEDFSKPHPFPPQPLYDYMGLELFLLRDANFWPHFPTSAEQIIDRYAYSTDIDPRAINGVIAIDFNLLILLVSALEPLYIPDLDTTLTQENVRDAIYGIWTAGEVSQEENLGDWFRSRKSFMGPIAQAMRNRIEQDFGSVNWIKLGQAVNQATKGRNLQIYTTNQELNISLSQIGWLGEMVAPNQSDVLSIVESNTGFNKVNPNIERFVTYSIDLQTPNQYIADLNIEYTNKSQITSTDCPKLTKIYTEGQVSYLDLTAGCYRNYLRILTPSNTELLDHSVHIYPPDYFFNALNQGKAQQEIDTVTDHTVLSNFVIVPQEQTIPTSFSYRLPSEIVNTDPSNGQFSYALTIQKQAGAKAYPLHVEINLPIGATLIDTSHTPVSSSSSIIKFDLIIDQDQEITVHFAP